LNNGAGFVGYSEELEQSVGYKAGKKQKQKPGAKSWSKKLEPGARA